MGQKFRIKNSELRIQKWFLLLSLISYLLLSVFIACVPKAKYLAENYTPPEKIAVLPFTNQAIDLDGPVLLRYLFDQRLYNLGYDTILFEEIDRKLHEMGITDAGQLPTTTPKELGEKLGVDGLIYGEVITFNYVTLGFYYSRTVEANFKLIDTKTENLLWEDERKISMKELQFKDVGKAFASQLIEKTLDKALKSPLRPESEAVVNISLRTLPRR
ncbi:MAG: DUF799 family lipoprotein [Elusimicrobia bacterium]|nr:DUF799 family lipoprotein [Elusimicrobiota bacterium]